MFVCYLIIVFFALLGFGFDQVVVLNKMQRMCLNVCFCKKKKSVIFQGILLFKLIIWLIFRSCLPSQKWNVALHRLDGLSVGPMSF